MVAEYETSEKLGSKFWLELVGVALAIGIGSLLLFLLMGAAWYRWGALGALIFFGAVALAVGFYYDRRQAKMYADSAP